MKEKENSGIKVDLEEIKEEPKKLTQSIESPMKEPKEPKERKNTDIGDNQRYRKSLVFEFAENEAEEGENKILKQFLEEGENGGEDFEKEETKIDRLSGNFMKEEKRDSGSSQNSGKSKPPLDFDFGDDFGNKDRKKKKQNNLLALLSNEDFSNMQQNIMNDLNKNSGNESPSDKEENKLIEEDAEILGVEHEENDEETLQIEHDGLPQNIFYQYQKNDVSQMRYWEDSEDEEMQI